jgi:type II secretory pathway predicted ATPase ExeA
LASFETASRLQVEFMTRKQSLPLEHWGFERWPFQNAEAADQFYPTAGNDEVLARIEYLVDAGRRLGALVGESGVGKSLLLQVAAKRLARQGRAVVWLSALGASVRELLWQIAAGLAVSPSADADSHRLWRQIADRMVENRLQQIHTILLVDDAGHAGPDVVTQLVRLTRLDTSPAARWTIVLAAEPGQATRWNNTLRELIDLRINLRPWDVEDTLGYVQTALVEAGSVEPVFDDYALTRLHELTEGIPRQVARLAERTLLAAAAAGRNAIDAAMVDAAHEEIAWRLPAALY